MKNNKFQEMKNSRWGSLTIAVCAGVILYVLLQNLGTIALGIGVVLSWFGPVFGGLVMAYVLNFFVVFLEKNLYQNMKNKKRAYTLSVVTAVVIAVVAVVLLTAILIPQLVTSFTDLITHFSGYVSSLNRTLESFSATSDTAGKLDLTPYINKIADQVQQYLTKNSQNILNGVRSTGTSVFNWIISFFLAIYFLMAKKALWNGAKKIAHMMFSEKNYASIADQYHRINSIFSRYIICEIIDALIVGGANALFMAILGMPYIALVSVVVGVTNLAPTFGPIVGAVIGSFILLLAEPRAVILFLIFTIILQTIDGYVIKPKMYGSALSVPSVFILIAIIVLGRMMGVVGILLAIPVAAIITYLVRDAMKRHDSRIEGA